MDRLWSPWRMEYVGSAGEGEGCIFCDALESGDDEGAGILHRGPGTFTILNAFPYNTGHLMIAPVRHVGDLSDLDDDERTEIMTATAKAVDVIRDALSAHGFNIGMNLGRVAGAGIPGHLHVHVVPRWGGDTNFMPVLTQTKVLPELLDETYAKLQPLFG